MATGQRPQSNDELALYLRTIQKYPLLSAHEEGELFRQWREEGDDTALERLILSHMRLAAKIARGFLGYGLPLGDLVSEATVGLIKAAGKFDCERGVRFSTYAIWWIRAELSDHVLRTTSIVRVGSTAAQKKLFFNLRRMKAARDETQAQLSMESAIEIAEELGVKVNDVFGMDQRLGAPDPSLNMPVMSDGVQEWQDLLVDDSPDQESRFADQQEFQVRRQLLHEGMKILSPRERDILVSRRLSENKEPLAQLAEKYSLSRERIRQIEIAAFEKLQKTVQHEARVN